MLIVPLRLCCVMRCSYKEVYHIRCFFWSLLSSQTEISVYLYRLGDSLSVSRKKSKQPTNRPTQLLSYKIRQTQHILVDICCTQHIDDRVDKEDPTKLARKFFAIIFKHPTGSHLLFSFSISISFPLH